MEVISHACNQEMAPRGKGSFTVEFAQFKMVLNEGRVVITRTSKIK